jgi:hypothetical protein
MTTCAICTDDITGPVHREPLGRNEALVAVCDACATEPPIAYDADTHYQPSGGLLGLDETIAASKRVMGTDEYLRQGRMEDEISRSLSPAMRQSDYEWKDYVASNFNRRRQVNVNGRRRLK